MPTAKILRVGRIANPTYFGCGLPRYGIALEKHADAKRIRSDCHACKRDSHVTLLRGLRKKDLHFMVGSRGMI
jgi:hypothetical protein